MTTTNFYSLTLCFALLAVSSDSSAQQFTKVGTLYVHASRASLRDQPQATATVLDQPVTNTQFKFLEKTGDWCQLAALNVNASAPERRGYMACSLLATQPLTMKMVEAQLSGKLDAKSRLDWVSRAFWISPSLAHWHGVGVALENAYLSPETRIAEITKTRPMRYKMPEFEAMKQKLATGIVVAADAVHIPYSALSQVLEGNDMAYPLLKSARQRVKLPAIKPSFFKKDEMPVVVPSEKYGETDPLQTIALIDGLSASNHVAYRVKVTAAARYAFNLQMNDMAKLQSPRLIRADSPLDMIIGVWDTAALQVSFDKPPVLHGVTVRGEPTAEEIPGMQLDYMSGIGCRGGPIHFNSRSLATYAKSAAAIVRWAGKPVAGGPTARAQVKSRQFGKEALELVLAHEIDLDNDGIVDFVIWQGRYEPQVSGAGIWVAVLGNINGQWMLLSYAADSDCT